MILPVCGVKIHKLLVDCVQSWHSNLPSWKVKTGSSRPQWKVSWLLLFGLVVALSLVFWSWSRDVLSRFMQSDTQSDLVYLDYFVSSNNVGLARYNWNHKWKEWKSFQSKCKQRWWCAVELAYAVLKGEQRKTVDLDKLST